MATAIQTHNLTKTYGANRGIRDVNLTIERGEIFGFLGPNGAGKSTTLRTVLGLMKPTSGRSEIFGLDSHTQTTDMLRHVGNLPTEFSMADRMTGREMISLFAKLRGLDDISHADEVANRLDADLDRPIRKLSRGNKQKIGIVQALFHKPDVVLLDEPTGGLDPLVQDSFLDLLVEAKERGQTIFFSSHVLSEIERVADRVGIIRGGVMVAVEDPHALTGRAHRHVRVEFVEALSGEDARHLASLSGVEDITVEDRIARFTARRDIDEIVKTLARHPITAIDIERPSLEEIFMTFYGPAENGEDA